MKGQGNGETEDEGQSDGANIKQSEAPERDTVAENNGDVEQHKDETVEEPVAESVAEKISEEDHIDGDLVHVVGKEAESVCCELEEANTFEVSLENANIVEVQEEIIEKRHVIRDSSAPGIIDTADQDTASTAQDTKSGVCDKLDTSDKELSDIPKASECGSENQDEFSTKVNGIPEEINTSKLPVEEIICPDHKSELSTDKHTSELATEVIVCPEHTEPTKKSNSIPDLDTFEESFRENLDEPVIESSIQVSVSNLYCPHEESHDQQLDTSGISVDITDTSQDSSGIKDTVDIDFEENSKTFVEKLKELKGNLLARHILREDSYSKIGSIDADDKADIEFVRILSQPLGKTLEEELRESTGQSKESKYVEEDSQNFASVCPEENKLEDRDKENISESNSLDIDNENTSEFKTSGIYRDTDTEKENTLSDKGKDSQNFASLCPEEKKSVDSIKDLELNQNEDVVVTKDQEIDVECNVMPEHRDVSIVPMPEPKDPETLAVPESSQEGSQGEGERSVSPAMMFASCRYRWEKTIITEAESVVFVTINNKDVEPLKLEWQATSGCFYSEEFKIPVGKYVGHLVVDGAFYPVEDVAVKHYTFEVDLYLKDDIVEDESHKSGLEKAESFVKQQGTTNGLETGPHQGTSDHRYSPARANNYTYPPTRARMEAGQDKEAADGSIHVTSKYEDLVRSQLNHTKSSILDDDVEPSHSIKSDYSDLDGRRSPVGDDGGKQYQDGDDTALKTADLGYGYRSDSGADRERFNKSVIEDDVEQQSIRSGGSKASHSGHGSPGIIDDVLGNGHARSPIYSTESPIHSRHSSAHNSAPSSTHSSARHTPTAAAPSPTRPESVGSNRSANSVSRNMLDDIINDSVRSDPRSPNPDANGDSRRGSGAVTPTLEQIGDVLNPADRHSPIRRDYFTDSPQLSHHSSQVSAHSSLHGSPHGSAHGSINGSTQGSQHGSTHGSTHGSAHGSAHSSQHGSTYGSQPGSAHSSQPGSAPGSQRQTPQLISDSLKASQERLYMSEDKRSYSGSQASGSLPGSRPQSITSEQELSQYYENDTDLRRTPLSGDGGSAARTGSAGSAGSLPVIGSQRGTPDKRSLTPDNHIRVPPVGPIMKGPLLPNRTPTRTPVSNASSRTITPVHTPVNTPSDAIEQIRELETTASNLRVLLAAKEQEVFDLKGQLEEVKDNNRTLQGDLDRQRARASPGPQIAELERKYHDAVEERERLSSEMVKLREEMRLKDEPSLNRYNPNSPTALQRKIDELSSQIADLHEVNESAVEERSGLERRLKDLAAENETLRSTQSSRQQGVEEENRQLKAENQRLKESQSQSGYSEVTDYRYRIELQQVKEDNRSLRDRNYTLHDDNIRLKEELAELRKSVELMSNVRKQYKDEGTGSRKMDRYEKMEETETLVETYSSDLGRHDYKKVDPVPPPSEERHRYSYKRSSRYDAKQDTAVKVEKEYETERFSKSDGTRYESYRVAGDGGACDKPTRASSKYDPRPLTPERPSALGPARKDYSISDSLEKKYDLYERRDEGRGRRDRNRTSSADLDFRSMPLSTYNDLTKTTPALSGRSREIYQELSDKRAAIKTKVPDNAQRCESEEKKPELELEIETDQTQNPTNLNSLSSKVFVNRYYPQNKESEEKTPDTDDLKRLNADRMDLAYAKSSPLLLSRPQKEEKGYDPRPAEAFLDDGDMSDTPTDILVSTQPLERLPPSATWARNRNRRGSVGSDASNSSFSDIDEQITASVRKRSKSADGREILRRSMQTNSLRASSVKGEKSLSRTLSPAPPHAGHRTVTPRPLATQHNKSSLNLSSSIGSLTHGLRPFAPRSAGDLQIGDVIKFSRQGGKLSQGTIRFIGHLPGRGDIYLGVELDKEDGKHDGVFEGIRYFKCKPSKGVFVAYNKVVMAWTV